ncbi:DUF6191 domain-containing protein [Kitasatospora brasiliensis]|uniref:DUF6191 domain-containing protein n=1 Tax=Kitasatospora brasiliensis TaxID=3058040 RepID=UPI0029315601|nr:DUF6191 domain-containing protein [Kitasatospora sp. K002]
MGLIVGVVAATAAVLGLVLLASWQVWDESSPRPRHRGPGVGVGAGGLAELHALFSPGKQVQIEQKWEQLVLRDDAQAAAPPHFGVDLDRGVAVLRGGGGTGPAARAPREAGVQASQVREQSTSR